MSDRRRKVDLRDAAAGAVAVVLLVAMSIVGWWLYASWRVGEIELTTEGQPLIVQLLEEASDSPVGEPFELAARRVVTLPEGEYRLRANGTGRLGRTYRFLVNRGERQTHAISLDEGRLLGGEPAPPNLLGKKAALRLPIPFARITAARELEPGRSVFIEWWADSLICLDAGTGKERWDTSHPKQPFDGKRDPTSWLPNLSIHSVQARLLDPAIDFDGDGTRDLVWYFRDAPAVLALSGVDGGIMWNFMTRPSGTGKPRDSGLDLAKWSGDEQRSGGVAGRPLVTDVDRDGTPDLLVTFEYSESEEEQNRRLAAAGGAAARGQEKLEKRVLGAMSGRSGVLWSYPMDQSFTELPSEHHAQLAMLVDSAKSTWVAFLDGTRWIGLDPASGRVAAGPIELGFQPVRPLQHGDLDGDGLPEILAMETGASSDSRTLHAFSIKTGREIWAVDTCTTYDGPGDVAPTWPRRFWDHASPTGSPLVADLDGDGRSEVVVPDKGPMLPSSGYRGVRLIDGATGQTRWVGQMRLETKAKQGVVHLATAPDLDGDGTRDVVVVSRYEGSPSAAWQALRDDSEWVFVDAFSGKDGRNLWWWSAELAYARTTWIWAPLWWGRGPDGWPLLVLPLGGDPIEQAHDFPPDRDLAKGVVHVLEATTGRERHTVLDLARVSASDLDGDGLDDLWGEANGELCAFRGEPPEVWRALGRFDPAGEARSSAERIGARSVDFDGDGVADTLIGEVRAPGRFEREPSGSRTAVARSGRDGHVIWKTGVDRRGSWFEPNSGDSFDLIAAPLPFGDFDGDGTADVAIRKTPGLRRPGSAEELQARVELLSGRTGARLWSASLLTDRSGLDPGPEREWIEARTIAPDGTPDLIAQSSGDNGFRLARISGRSGRTIWDIPTSTRPSLGFGGNPPHAFGGFDGDGWLDVVFALPHVGDAGETEYTLTAVSLRDGKVRWSQRVGFQSGMGLLGDVRVGDVDGDKRPDVVVLEAQGNDSTKQLAVRVIDGSDGSSRWTWKGGLAQNVPDDWQAMTLANLDGTGTQSVCVCYFIAQAIGGVRKIVILDQHGKERVGREQRSFRDAPRAVDLDGDGRDELVFMEGYGGDEQLRVWDRDLKDLWSWPVRPKKGKQSPLATLFAKDDGDFAMMNLRARDIERMLPGSSGHAGKLIVTPGLAIDGVSGKALWTGQAFLWNAPVEGIVKPYFAPRLLDPGEKTGRPLLIGNGLGATVCRAAMATDAQGAIAGARGQVWRAGTKGASDPRWTRPLPWCARLTGLLGPKAIAVAAGLAVVNVVIPLLVLRLIVGRKRVFRLWALMFLPVAAAVPLLAYLWLTPWLPVGESKLVETEGRVFLAGTLGGLPVVLYFGIVGNALVLLRWRRVVLLGGLTLGMAAIVGGAWVLFDMRSMVALERYGWEGWYLVFLVGAYAAGVLWVLWRGILGAYRMVTRRRGLGAVG